MTELETKTEAETEDFAGDLSDEALDRGEEAYASTAGGMLTGCSSLPRVNR